MKTLLPLILIALTTQNFALATEINEANECWMDHLSMSELKARNLWARQNRFLTARALQDYNTRGVYARFNVTSTTGAIDITGLDASAVHLLGECHPSDPVALMNALIAKDQAIAVAILDYTEANTIHDFASRTPLMIAASQGLEQVADSPRRFSHRSRSKTDRTHRS